MAIVHELSWSASRGRNFEECRRRYFWDYYGSWRGWEARASEARRSSYLLKKMTRMPMWAGDCLHDALAWWFAEKQRGHVASAREVEEHALGRLREGYRQSRDGEWKRRPSKLTHLAEHHYGEAEIDEGTGAAGEYGKRYVERIRAGIACFFESDELVRVREAASADYLACEEMGTIELFGVRVFAIPDFAFRDSGAGSDEVWIYDWKSGRPRDEDVFQLSLYVHYAAQRWGVDPGAVRCVDAYLPDRDFRELRFSPADLEGTLAQVESSVERMRAMHFDADREEGEREAFPMISEEQGAARVCGRCNYRELCSR